jgi:hypothetical protein
MQAVGAGGGDRRGDGPIHRSRHLPDPGHDGEIARLAAASRGRLVRHGGHDGLRRAVLLVSTVYLLISFAFLYVLPLEQIASNNAFVSQFGGALFGSAGARVLSVCVLLSVLGGLLALTLSASAFRPRPSSGCNHVLWRFLFPGLKTERTKLRASPVEGGYFGEELSSAAIRSSASARWIFPSRNGFQCSRTILYSSLREPPRL